VHIFGRSLSLSRPCLAQAVINFTYPQDIVNHVYAVTKEGLGRGFVLTAVPRGDFGRVCPLILRDAVKYLAVKYLRGL
jgi:hypothetical protein